MAFDFEVPADLTALNAEEFAAFRAKVTEHATALSANEAATATELTETAALLRSFTTEDKRRKAEAEQAAADRAALAEFTSATTEPEPAAPEVEPEAEEVPEAEPAAPATEPEQTPAPVQDEPENTAVTASRSTIDMPAEDEPVRRASLYASSDVPNAGAPLADFTAASALLEQRLTGYSSATRSNPRARRIGGEKSNAFSIDGRTMHRHGVAQIRRELAPELRLTDANRTMSVLEYAGRESRLAGGSLANTMLNQIKNGRSLTAAVGWCAPSETIYDLCMLEEISGILDLPQVQASRGGFQIPQNGGPDFTSIWNGIGDDGDTILTEYDVENGTDKVCVEVPCPPFVDVRLDVNYLCITGNLLQSRGYPEAVTRFTQGAMVAFAHKQNASVIARMVAQSTAVTTITQPAPNNDAASQILSAVEIAAVDMRYRNRMSPQATLEVVLPVWAIAQIRASIARRAGVAELAVTDAEIMSWFAVRSIAPRFVYDWQDQFSGGDNTTPGGANSLVQLPQTVDFLIYPAGTWVLAVRDVVNLDTVYDNALLTQNQYTALFLEDGFNVLRMCVDSRVYRTPSAPVGIVGQPA